MALVHDIDNIVAAALPFPSCIYERIKVQSRRETLKDSILALLEKNVVLIPKPENEARELGGKEDRENAATGNNG